MKNKPYMKSSFELPEKKVTGDVLSLIEEQTQAMAIKQVVRKGKIAGVPS